MINLRVCLLSIEKPVPKVFEEIGIVYQIAIVQTIADQVWLIDCDNVPKKLPKGIKKLNVRLNELPLSDEQWRFLRNWRNMKRLNSTYNQGDIVNFQGDIAKVMIKSGTNLLLFVYLNKDNYFEINVDITDSRLTEASFQQKKWFKNR